MSNKIVEMQKLQNTKTILQVIRTSPGIMKTRLTEIVGLSFATVSSICNELVAKEILREESSPSKRLAGRNPKQLFLKDKSYFAICLDFQNLGSVKASIQDIAGNCVFQYTQLYSSPNDIQEIIVQIKDMVFSRIHSLGLIPSRFIGVGAAIAGIFDRKTETIEACAIAQWDGLAMKEMLQTVFEMPAYVDNEANLCVSQQLSYPSLEKHSDNVVYLHLGEGIGAGIIGGGQLIRGETGYAAEISHLPIGNKAIPCARCGNYGCAETELSKKGFVSKYAALIGISEEKLEWDDFVKAVKTGDVSAREVVSENAELIADCVITLMMLFDPKEFLIGGSVLDIYEYLQEEILNKVRNLGPHYTEIPISIEPDQNLALTNGIMEMLIWRWEPLSKEP